jgi:hypothetical protein
MMETVTIEPNKVFAWREGLRLIPAEKAVIEFPGGLIRDGEQIGTIIEVSDDAEVSFQPSTNPKETFSRITLKVTEGDGIRINRGTQAMLVGKSPIVFQIEP